MFDCYFFVLFFCLKKHIDGTISANKRAIFGLLKKSIIRILLEILFMGVTKVPKHPNARIYKVYWHSAAPVLLYQWQ